MDYEKDLEIIEAATDGPRDIVEWAGALSIASKTYPFELTGSDVEFYERFNPSYTRELVEKAQESTQLKRENDELRAMINELREQIGVIEAICDSYADSYSPQGWGLLLKPAGKVGLCIQDAQMLRLDSHDHDIEVAERVLSAAQEECYKTRHVTLGDTIRNLPVEELLKDV